MKNKFSFHSVKFISYKQCSIINYKKLKDMRFKKTIIEDSTKIKFKRKDSTKTKIKFKRNDNKDQRFSKFLPSPRGVFNDVT